MAARNRTEGFVDPCIPTLAAKPPSGPDWVHEIKHDGYRLIVRRDGKAVRLFTRRGHDWTDRYPAIASAAAKLRAKSFTLDGEAVVTARTGSLCSMRSTGGTRPRTRCYTHSTSWSSTARICGRCRSATARRSWRGCWRGRRPASRSMSTPTRTAPWCSGTPASSGSSASCRSGSVHPTGRDPRGTGSR
jgi:hypothetical protein